MDDMNIEDEDREALQGLSAVPQPQRNIHSHSQQLRAPSRPKHHHKGRKHSLDDIPKPTLVSHDHPYNNNYGCSSSDDDDDDGFFPRNSSSSSNTTTPLNHPRSRGGSGEDFFIGQDHELRQYQPLPEFIGTGGGSGIFKLPTRSAVHAARPPSVELRPHPLRETQVGKFLRNVACTDTQLWAGQESGVRFWSFENTFETGCGLGGRVRRGDEDAAPFHESGNTSPTWCLIVDSASRLVWSGHKDGKIRSWKMDQPLDDANGPFKEGLSWQAHKGPVISMVMSSYGNIFFLFVSFALVIIMQSLIIEI